MKRLVVCCDGTWNTPEMACPTNVVKIAQAVTEVDRDGIQQILFYDEGIGTQNLMDKFAGGALGKGIDLNIQQAYRFLALNYSPGDEIYLYGFSRGSYTVRSLAGMIGFAGMLERRQIEWVKEAYELYRTYRRQDTGELQAFRNTHGTEVPDITFMGCWDTVEALGLPNKIDFLKIDEAFKERYRFINAQLGSHIQKAAHAVAIDEIRMEFDVTLMEETPGRNGSQVAEVWFPGDHGCVGGGATYKLPLSSMALEWMVEQTRAHTNLELNTAQIPGCENGFQTDPLIFFDNEPALIYSQKFRDVPPNIQFHFSARDRFVNLPRYADRVSSKFRDGLARACREMTPRLNLLDDDKEIEVGEIVHAVIYSREYENTTHVRLREGCAYRISPLPTQRWQDGKLEPCGPRGWNMADPLIQEQIKVFGRAFINIGERLDVKVVDEADWFELIGRVKQEDDALYNFRIGDGSLLDNGVHRAKENGVLFALANDAKKLFVDQYDNNKGWIIIAIERIS